MERAQKIAEFASSAPYPEIKVFGKNKYYAELLMDVYCGPKGELTAIGQYKYHALMFKRVNKKLADVMNKIAEVEWRHFELLADVILSLGVEPAFREGGAAKKNWSAENLEYGKDLPGRLKSDLELKLNAIRSYRERIQMIQDTAIQRLLRRIVLDELIHVRIFREAIDKYCMLIDSGKKDSENIQRTKTAYRIAKSKTKKRLLKP